MLRQDCVKCTKLVECRTQIVYATPCHSHGLLVIGEAPGKDEDLSGEGFMGVAGKTLDRILAAQQITRSDYGRANICRCRPPENRKPTAEEINSCLPYLAQLIIEVKPKVVLTIGSTPTAVFCGKNALYATLISSWQRGSCDASYYIPFAHPEIAKVLQYINYIVPSPHTSPLAFNRNSPSGEKWGVITARQIATAVKLLS